MEYIVIIGNGIFGVIVVRYIWKFFDKWIIIIFIEIDYFFLCIVFMYIYMGYMKYEYIKLYEDFFWKKNRIELKRGFVVEVKLKDKKVIFNNGEEMVFDKFIIVVGLKLNKFGWLG